MTTEEKAKAYDNALEKARKLCTYPTTNFQSDLEDIFPELKESEDERIRKELITHCRNTRCVTEEGAERIAKWIAWLEKQDSHYTFEIKKGYWYKCVCDYMLNGSDLIFKNGRLYYYRRDWRLEGEIDERNVKDIGVNGYKSFFRPATNQEIKDWLEKQGKNNSCKFTFEDVLALECSMKTAKTIKGGDELYKILVPLYNKIHNAYLLEKQGKQKKDFHERYDKIADSEWFKKTHENMSVETDDEPQGKTALEAINEVKVDNAIKVESKPKFKVGDWIACEELNTALIVNIDDDKYEVEFIDGNKGFPHIDYIDRFFHLWSIQDAKDWDVLVDVYGNIGIYEKCDDFDWMSYCSLGHNGGFQHFKIEHENEKTYPATKEQRDLLFSKMREAGYEWDEVKKELKKIEDGIEIPFSVRNSELQEVTYYIPKDFHAEIDDDKVVIKKSGKSIAWTKEDDKMCQETIDWFEKKCFPYALESENPARESIKWLKSLKKR